MAEPMGDMVDELLRKVDKLEETNGALCEEINRQERVIEEQRAQIARLVSANGKLREEINRQERLIERMRRLIKALFISHGFMCGLAGMDEDEFERVVLAKWVDRLRDVGIEVDE